MGFLAFPQARCSILSRDILSPRDILIGFGCYLWERLGTPSATSYSMKWCANMVSPTLPNIECFRSAKSARCRWHSIARAHGFCLWPSSCPRLKYLRRYLQVSLGCIADFIWALYLYLSICGRLYFWLSGFILAKVVIFSANMRLCSR